MMATKIKPVLLSALVQHIAMADKGDGLFPLSELSFGFNSDTIFQYVQSPWAVKLSIRLTKSSLLKFTFVWAPFPSMHYSPLSRARACFLCKLLLFPPLWPVWAASYCWNVTVTGSTMRGVTDMGVLVGGVSCCSSFIQANAEFTRLETLIWDHWFSLAESLFALNNNVLWNLISIYAL